MSKFKRIIEFILALLNFLFHFKVPPLLSCLDKSPMNKNTVRAGFNFDKIVSFAVIHSTKWINPIP